MLQSVSVLTASRIIVAMCSLQSGLIVSDLVGGPRFSPLDLADDKAVSCRYAMWGKPMTAPRCAYPLQSQPRLRCELRESVPSSAASHAWRLRALSDSIVLSRFSPPYFFSFFHIIFSCPGWPSYYATNPLIAIYRTLHRKSIELCQSHELEEWSIRRC